MFLLLTVHSVGTNIFFNLFFNFAQIHQDTKNLRSQTWTLNKHCKVVWSVSWINYFIWMHLAAVCVSLWVKPFLVISPDNKNLTIIHYTQTHLYSEINCSQIMLEVKQDQLTRVNNPHSRYRYLIHTHFTLPLLVFIYGEEFSWECKISKSLLICMRLKNMEVWVDTVTEITVINITV